MDKPDITTLVLHSIAGESTPKGFTPYTGKAVWVFGANSLKDVVTLRSKLIEKINKKSTNFYSPAIEESK